jgi:hypothetical protein
MDCNLFKTLVDNIDFVGLDTQPLRDLFSKSNNNQIDIKKFDSHINNLINVFFTRNFEKDSKPEIVKLILIQLEHDLLNTINSNPTTLSNNDSPFLLEALMDIKQELRDLRNYNPTNTRDQNEKDFSEDIRRVFVNPLDSVKYNELQSNVNIEETISNTIDNKLNKLKKLKRGE